MEADRELCRAAGMDDFIAKPFSANEMLAVVARHITP
jgi:CheY-like chemotaxis protein